VDEADDEEGVVAVAEKHTTMTDSGFTDVSDAIVWMMNRLDTTFVGHELIKIELEQSMSSEWVHAEETKSPEWTTTWGVSITGHVEVPSHATT
jgi:hypothetical protein